jgi:hypothetical protein
MVLVWNQRVTTGLTEDPACFCGKMHAVFGANVYRSFYRCFVLRKASPRLGTARGLENCLELRIEFSTDVSYPLIAELAKQRRWQIVLEDSTP